MESVRRRTLAEGLLGQAIAAIPPTFTNSRQPHIVGGLTIIPMPTIPLTNLAFSCDSSRQFDVLPPFRWLKLAIF
jgi:hypothetical protein